MLFPKSEFGTKNLSSLPIGSSLKTELLLVQVRRLESEVYIFLCVYVVNKPISPAYEQLIHLRFALGLFLANFCLPAGLFRFPALAISQNHKKLLKSHQL
jgi:hypothetical protein